MKVAIAVGLAFILSLCQPAAYAAEKGYWGQLGETFTRGVKNVISSPWEIPYSIHKHDKTDNGNPRLVRDTTGLVDGIFRTVTRFGCGAWDMVWAFVPGDQEGLPLKPETFF